jgi:cell division protein FtsN
MKFERGGLMLGLIIGLLIGLAVALGVALWVTKAPVPFVNKVPQRTAEQDAAELERNKNWDPNAALGGKPVVPRAPAPAASATATAAAPASAPPAAKAPARDPAAILAGAPVAAPAPKAPAPDAKSAKPGSDPFIYFVQAGAFQSSDDAEQRRAKVAMLGLESKITEREQSGRTVFRVRIGPYDKQAEADAVKDKLTADSVEAVLVRIERPAR